MRPTLFREVKLFFVKSFSRIDSKIYLFFNRRKLKNKDFTIVADNCWGGFVYQDLNLEYKSPFVGLFLFPECYLKLLSDFYKNINLPLYFIQQNESKYSSRIKSLYPIGILSGTDIEIHFLHYSSVNEAFLKWNRRKNRINKNNIIFKINGYSGNRIWIEKFKQLPYKNKIILDEHSGPSEIKYTYPRKIHIVNYLNSLI